MHNKNNTKSTLNCWQNFKLRIVMEGILVGLISGLVVVLYRFLLEKAIEFARFSYSLQLQRHYLIPIWFCILIVTGYIVGLIIKKEPMASGSGIPQVEGVLLRKLNMNWWKVILGKFIGGVLCIGAGLSLGREGPSIQIGASVGQGFSRIFKRLKIEEKFLITSGASAGLSAAFNAPLAGVVFSLEEIHKNFSPIVLTSALAAAITSDFVSKEFFGLKPVFNFSNISVLPLSSYLYLVILGVITGILGVLFNKALFNTQDIYANQKWLPKEARPIIPFLVAGLLGLIIPEVLGGGHEVVTLLVSTPFTIKMLLILIIVKFLFTMVSFGSGAPGGIFLPLLVIGALIGNIYGNVLSNLFGFNSIYIKNLIILGMAGYFTSIVKAPITGIILITEMTGSFQHLLSISVVCIMSYIISDIMKSKPVYEALLNRMINKGENVFKGNEKTKVLIETCVLMGCELDGKKIKEVNWPSNCLIVGIKRGHDEIIPDGETLIYPGDYLISLVNEDSASNVRDSLSHFSENIKK